MVEQSDAGHGTDGRGDRVNDLRATPFAHVWNAFDDGHRDQVLGFPGAQVLCKRSIVKAQPVRCGVIIIAPMSDPLRHVESALSTETGRNTRIEELLLAGLDHYFKGQHELAINVWTRVLFLDRSHARARAYIERARSAIAERQREGEELLQTGAAAFQRGDAVGARRLLTSAVERGISPDEALALLDRLDRLAPGDESRPAGRDLRASRRAVEPVGTPPASGTHILTLLLVLAIGLTLGALVMIYWNAWVPVSVARTPVATSGIRAVEPSLPVPPAAEVAIARAHTLQANGKLRDALAALDAIRPGDSLQPQADELRTLIQHQLLEAARATPQPASPSR